MQKTYYVIFESITSALRGKEILNRVMIPSQIRRTPREYSRLGCGYCLVLFEKYERAIKILEKNAIKVLAVKER